MKRANRMTFTPGNGKSATDRIFIRRSGSSRIEPEFARRRFTFGSVNAVVSARVNAVVSRGEPQVVTDSATHILISFCNVTTGAPSLERRASKNRQTPE